MGKCLLAPLLLIVLLAEASLCVEVDFGGRPARPVEEEEVNPFDVISKQTKDDVLPATGRSVESRTVYQGDIVLDEAENAALGLGRSTTQNIIVLTWPRKLWRTRTVPYIISGQSYDAVQKIEAAMRDLEKRVCLKFRKHQSGDKAWLNIYRGNSCWANIGRSLAFGKTDVSLGPSCLSQTLIQHELIHALGFFHEQSRRDRDNYVNVLNWNISPANLYNFDKTKKYEAETFGVPYDYSSIMHYTKTTWTKNGQDTMQAKNDPDLRLGGTVLSKYDVMKLNLMYHCHDKSGERWTEWSDWSRCIRNNYGCYRSKHRICLVENLALCPGADDYGVQSNAQKCPSPSYCDVEPVDGFWGSWSSWSACSKSCDKGTRTRSRQCNSPTPANGGKKCKGAATDTEKCMRRTCTANKYYTNFDNGFGVWSNVQGRNDPLNWQRGRGKTSQYSGPQSDHTDGNGWYLYVSTASYTSHKKRAGLISEYLSGKKCISLAYCMRGKNMGRLDFSLQTSSGQWFNFPFTKKGHQGNGWHHAEFSLVNQAYTKTSYRFLIEATTGIGPYSDIAIDDILIENGACGAGQENVNAVKPKPGVAAVVSEGCKNKDKNCISWAKSGQCHLNQGYMLESCCLACRSMGECKDSYSATGCPEWASKGECVKNDKWMWKNCCTSCKKQGKCSDSNKNCKTWANDGWCNNDSYVAFMWTNCCSSCSDSWRKSKNCSDSNAKCSEWARDGECKKNPDWMLKNCCKSCKS
ncbi:uncharacterized protein LOC135694184 isoform X2 [Rhopilema esculentum]|uniref:uncharacterized protein LOC135694184 isoform X2 n=1 Tax=Rhopilema esculentum TaxID=499914 RepID=UPI0031CFE6A7